MFALSLPKLKNKLMKPIEPTNIQIFAMGLSAIIAGSMLCSFMWAVIDLILNNN